MLRALTLPWRVRCDTTLLQILETCRAPMIWASPTRKPNSTALHSTSCILSSTWAERISDAPCPLLLQLAPTPPDLSSLPVPHDHCAQHATHTALHGIGENQGHARPRVRSTVSCPAMCPQQGRAFACGAMPPLPDCPAQFLHCHHVALASYPLRTPPEVCTRDLCFLPPDFTVRPYCTGTSVYPQGD